MRQHCKVACRQYHGKIQSPRTGKLAWDERRWILYIKIVPSSHDIEKHLNIPWLDYVRHDNHWTEFLLDWLLDARQKWSLFLFHFEILFWRQEAGLLQHASIEKRMQETNQAKCLYAHLHTLKRSSRPWPVSLSLSLRLTTIETQSL